MTYAHLRLGRPPFATRNLMELMRCHQSRTPDLGDLSAAEKEVLLRALAKDPHARYPNCKEFSQAIEDVLGAARRAAAASSRQVPEVAPEAQPRSASHHDYETLRPPPTGSPVAVVTRPVAPAPKTQPEIPGPPPEGRRRFAVVAALVVLAALAVGYVARQWFGESSPSQQLATLPRGCTPAEGATVVSDRFKLQYYSRVDYRLPDGTRIPFVLVRAAGEMDPPTFYIMQDKVSNGLFGKFVQATRQATDFGLIGCLGAPMNAPWQGASLLLSRHAAPSQWQLGATVDREVDGEVREQDVGSTDPNLPVFRMTVVEAHRFARWLGGLLPSLKEWDKAAGRYEAPRREGPFQGTWEEIKTNKADRDRIAVDRKTLGPVPLDRDTLDVSPFGCCHMSGNGKEWTNTLYEPADRAVSEFADTGFPPSRVVLRGWTYKWPGPLLFRKLDKDAGATGAREPEDPSPEIGFRVVLHP
jgi:formylglycine-generating enzyme required for sulfatase activity